MKAISKYLETHAEWIPEIDRIASFGPFGSVVVIPVCGEDAILDGLFDSLVEASEEAGNRVLAILVVNEDSRTHLDHRFANRAVLDRFKELSKLSDRLVLAVLDRTQGLEKCGVGTARKIGCDLALALYHRKVTRSEWIHTTDADARVAGDYFEMRPSSAVPWGLGPLPMGAMIHPFSHSTDGEMGKELEIYDGYLRYYYEGLAKAGSPFAYPTIGSTMSFTAEAYAQVRGFPKKDAGEDFYFLHKIAKVAFVWPGGGEVRLECRASNRVPFGTGQSIAKIRALLEANKAYEVYAPEVFEELASWYRAMDALCDGENWESAANRLSEPLRKALESSGAIDQAKRIASEHAPGEARLRHWHTWFDGFKILKLIHALRDSAYPNVAFLRTPADRFDSVHHGLESGFGVFGGDAF